MTNELDRLSRHLLSLEKIIREQADEIDRLQDIIDDVKLTVVQLRSKNLVLTQTITTAMQMSISNGKKLK